jgi:hypothetical protein
MRCVWHIECSTYKRKEMHTAFWLENKKLIHHQEDVEVYEMIILHSNSQKLGWNNLAQDRDQ